MYFLALFEIAHNTNIIARLKLLLCLLHIFNTAKGDAPLDSACSSMETTPLFKGSRKSKRSSPGLIEELLQTAKRLMSSRKEMVDESDSPNLIEGTQLAESASNNSQESLQTHPDNSGKTCDNCGNSSSIASTIERVLSSAIGDSLRFLDGYST